MNDQPFLVFIARPISCLQTHLNTCVFFFFSSHFTLCRSGPNVKERPEGLGRILKSVPISEDELSELAADADVDDKEPHPYRYDIEWVLGGRASNVERHELVYTTAEAEGMLDGGPRRKRKATTEPAKTTETTATAASTKQASKKRSKAAAGGAKGKKKASTTNSSASRKPAS